MFSCKAATRLICESRDRRLSRWEGVSLRVHLALCRLCRGFARDLRRLSDALRAYSGKLESGTVSREVSLSPEARQRILRAMEKGNS
jgi:hypothetical protein